MSNVHGRPVMKNCEKCGVRCRHLYFCKMGWLKKKMYVCAKCVKKWGGYYPACTLSRSRSKEVMEMKR